MTSAHEMIALPGGTFVMGSDRFHPEEQPVHERRVAPFRIDRHPVTNRQFAAFAAATGYRTVAERPSPAPDGAPGSMVFTPTKRPVDLRDWRNWWRWQPGASWRAPFGPGSSTARLGDHPVVHVAFEDAAAYAAWAGLRLPTEAEHEYAARGGLAGAAYAWGDEMHPDGVAMANSWLGRFPYDNRGWGSTSPVGSYPPNGYGLVDATGNVWEWTSDYFTPRHRRPAESSVDPGRRENLLARASAEAASGIPRRVLKGGSFLCSPDYCLRFRPAARSAQAEDTGMSHVGFRCAADG